MSRQVVLDTETTGLSPSNGDRIIEIGCVEVINFVPTSKHYHTYINPMKTVSEKAFEIHGLSNDFLAKFPKFEEICQDFLDFVGSSDIIAHNAQFDINFINNELKLINKSPLNNKVIDTLDIARQKFPGSKLNLDALCTRFLINNSSREKHGALIDAQLLSSVYLELNGGRQQEMFANCNSEQESILSAEEIASYTISEIKITKNEEFEHMQMLEKIQNPLWMRKNKITNE
ncbi:DNA polymerase III subunit epsilon [Candidatus Gromoviella agglomerans]|uniref:DNA polymerase III subunit epsilon n=1 Tax=Candidatus Gromoviella agglomerans TaxID=2806609 RepID=UPI001E632AC2|nr:DNA polymerase III subunit epsilon [Candidatus Gromoviella agglomerans]UFX98338.1 DNA polymerase III subunit epsilon [Candidatus Gromoviella agglomerans]